jgi:hypothetical protein
VQRADDLSISSCAAFLKAPGPARRIGHYAEKYLLASSGQSSFTSARRIFRTHLRRKNLVEFVVCHHDSASAPWARKQRSVHACPADKVPPFSTVSVFVTAFSPKKLFTIVKAFTFETTVTSG